MTLAAHIVETPLPFDAERAESALARLRTGGEEAAALNDVLAMRPQARQLLLGTFGCSPFLAETCLRHPALTARCLLLEPHAHLMLIRDELRASMRAAANQIEAMRALRAAKRAVALLVALADLGGVWGVDEATAALSEAADLLVAEAVEFLLRQAAQNGDFTPLDPSEPARGSRYVVIAMGKHGARELNYSSDIDLIALYEPDAPLRPGLEAGAFFVRLTRDLVRLLQERTEGGYVFRTDLRLRPDPASTQIAISTPAALHYYESAGQNWERAAFIKARPVAGDIAAGAAFLGELTPYLWRKYLDYAAIADIHAMKRQIHAHRGHGRVAVAGHNLKLGRGGIREIEFFVQTQQLIAGGRQPDLRAARTVDALERLAARGWIALEAAVELTEAYRFLRRVEHRLQMLNDEQTHSLPSDPAGLERIARFCAFASANAFAAALLQRLGIVERHYARLFENVPELSAPGAAGSLVFTGASDDPATVETLSRMGFAYPASVIATVRGWHYGRYPAMRSAKARERLTELTPALLDALARTASPDQALAAFDGFLAELPAGIQLFSLLRNNPGLLRLIADIMGSAPRLSRVLSRRRRVLDAVLDPGGVSGRPSDDELRSLLRTEIAAVRNYEEALNRARVVGQEQGFLIGVGQLTGAIDATQAGEAYSALAGGLIETLQEQVEALLERTHGALPGAGAAVIGMGKLGGREMTPASDLDLIVIYDFDSARSMSDGLKPVPASLYYTRFTQRLISALSAGTSEGTLYEVDMRLRPSGNSGPVATSLSSFEAYQRHQAWTWEHMALTRARVVSGPDALRRRLESVIVAALRAPRDADKLRRDVREMRARLATHKGGGGPWDLKLARGGLVDVEFIAQALQLLHAAANPGILRQNTLAALATLRDAGLLRADRADALSASARLHHALTQILRLCLDGPFEPAKASEGLKARLAATAAAPDFARLEAELRERQEDTARLFDEILPPD